MSGKQATLDRLVPRPCLGSRSASRSKSAHELISHDMFGNRYYLIIVIIIIIIFLLLPLLTIPSSSTQYLIQVLFIHADGGGASNRVLPSGSVLSL